MTTEKLTRTGEDPLDLDGERAISSVVLEASNILPSKPAEKLIGED